MFETVVGQTGKETPSKFRNFVKNKRGSADASSFVKDYLPTTKSEGTQKMRQLSRMLGDEDFAKNVIKHNMFKSSIDKQNVNSFINKFDSLSKDQKDYLFDEKQRNMVSTLSRMLKSKKDVLTDNEKHNVMKTVLSTALGYGGAHYAGVDPLIGLAAGAVVPSFYNKVLSSVMSHPGAQNLASSDLTAIGNQLRKVMPRMAVATSVRSDDNGDR